MHVPSTQFPSTKVYVGMKLVTLALVGSALAIENAAVYKQSVYESTTIPQNDAVLNLAFDFGISRYYNVENVENLDNIMLANSIKDENKEKKLIIIVNGVEHPSRLFTKYNKEPSFNVEIKNDRKANEFKSFIKDIPNKVYGIKSALGYHMKKLSDEITVVSPSTKKINYLHQLWNKYFHEAETNKVESFWNGLKGSFSEQGESILKINKRSMDHINDESFINELTQLEFFLADESNIENDVIINLDSLLSIYKKTGLTQTYEICLNMISRLINEKITTLNVDSTVIALPIDQSLQTLKDKQTVQSSQYSKRSTESLFKSKRSGSLCFSNQLACIESTDSCSGHGICTLVGDCYKCLCSATKDDSGKQTTYWTGNSCEKIDYSAQFNLLFWTTIILIATIVSGVKLMYKAGEEELPGVLLAATVNNKKNN